MPFKSLWLIIHVFLLVYWLGADLGVYYSSKFVVRRDLSNETRATVAKVMEAVDLSPRICLVLFLPSGISLMATDPKGVAWLTWQLATLSWLLSFGWLYMVITQYRTHGKNPFLSKVDLYIRYSLIVGLSATALYTIIASEPFGVTTNPKWLGGKVLVYAIAIAGGVGIRKALVPFGPAFGSIMSKGSTPEAEDALTASMKRAIPWVHLIWLCVIISSILGIAKPGMKFF